MIRKLEEYGVFIPIPPEKKKQCLLLLHMHQKKIHPNLKLKKSILYDVIIENDIDDMPEMSIHSIELEEALDKKFNYINMINMHPIEIKDLDRKVNEI